MHSNSIKFISSRCDQNQSASQNDCQKQVVLNFKTVHNNGEITSRAHSSVTPPICRNCARKEAFYFDTSCSICWSLLDRDDATPSHVFAILRLWLPQIQKCIIRLTQKAMLLLLILYYRG